MDTQRRVVSLIAAAARGQDDAAWMLARAVEDRHRYHDDRTAAAVEARRVAFTAARIEHAALWRESGELEDAVRDVGPGTGRDTRTARWDRGKRGGSASWLTSVPR